MAPPRAMSLPDVQDFTVTERPEEDADGFAAWKNFGGLTIEEAYAKFSASAEVLQEDFMWMGDRAFAFYFPVLDRYVREVEAERAFDDQAWVLAHCIAAHVAQGSSEADRAATPAGPAAHLENQLASLCDFVLDGLGRAPERADRSRPVHEVASAWNALRAQIALRRPPG